MERPSCCPMMSSTEGQSRTNIMDFDIIFTLGGQVSSGVQADLQEEVTYYCKYLKYVLCFPGRYERNKGFQCCA